VSLDEAPVVTAPPSAQSAEGVDRACPKGHPFDPDHNFCCKMRFWRENGMQTHIPASWGGTNPTQREIRDDIYAAARRDGRDIQRAR
jgi:hypothetical protein